MNILYIIGNGFDSHFGLKTKTKDFINKLKKQNVWPYGFNSAKEMFSYYWVDWGEYEESLADIDLKSIEEDNITYPNYLSDHEYDREGCIFDMQTFLETMSKAKNNALIEMIEEANEKVLEIKNNRKSMVYFDETDKIVSFNYTSTLEELFNIPEELDILHIHGYYKNNKNKLIFGYKNSKNHYEERIYADKEDSDFYVESQKESILEFYRSLQKQLQKDELNKYLDNCKEIKKIIVLGHSFSDVDIEYMEIIQKRINCPKWLISYHSNYFEMKKKIKKLSFNHKCKLFRWWLLIESLA